MIRSYRVLIRSRIAYGSFIYGFTTKSELPVIDPVLSTGICLVTGAFRTSRLQSLYLESVEPQLSVRRNLLLCKYVAMLATHPKHLVHAGVFCPTSCHRYKFLVSVPRPADVLLQDLRRPDIHLPMLFPLDSQELHPALSYNLPAICLFLDMQEA
jgi:hypothetical protein